MGGKKKRSMKRAERTQQKTPHKKEKRGAASPTEKKTVPGITMPNVKSDKFAAELKKMKVITPSTVASRFELRLSIARQFLKELESKGMIKFVSKSSNLRIYKPAD